MLPTYSLMSQVTPTQKLSPEIQFVTLSVSLKWWWKGDGLHKSRKYEFTVWLFHFSVIHAPSLSYIYIHNVCTVTLYNYIYYVYVHICTGHQRYVSCYSSVPTCPLKTWASKKKWQVFIIQFITPLTIIIKCICKLCSLLLCQFKQIRIIFAQVVINIIVRELITIVIFIPLDLSNCTE